MTAGRKLILKRILVGLLVAMPAAYALDDLSSRFGIPPRPRFGSYTIRRYYYIHEKYNKFSYEPMPRIDETCVNTLFPHSGVRPCWYVRRHTFQTLEVG